MALRALRQFNDKKVFAVCFSVTSRVGKLLREAKCVLFLSAIGQLSEMTVVAVCDLVTDTVVIVGIERGAGTWAVFWTVF